MRREMKDTIPFVLFWPNNSACLDDCTTLLSTQLTHKMKGGVRESILESPQIIYQELPSLIPLHYSISSFHAKSLEEQRSKSPLKRYITLSKSRVHFQG